MLNLTRLHLGIAHESQFQGLGISWKQQVAFMQSLSPDKEFLGPLLKELQGRSPD